PCDDAAIQRAQYAAETMIPSPTHPYAAPKAATNPEVTKVTAAFSRTGTPSDRIPATALAQLVSKHTCRTKGLSQPTFRFAKHAWAVWRSSLVSACPVLVEPSEPAGGEPPSAAGRGSWMTTLAMLAGLRVQIDAA